MTVEKNGTVVRHLPRKVLRVCALLLKREGSTQCTVTGKQRYSADLPQGGVEIPCFVVFKASAKEIQKLKHIMKCIELYIVCYYFNILMLSWYSGS